MYQNRRTASGDGASVLPNVRTGHPGTWEVLHELENGLIVPAKLEVTDADSETNANHKQG